VRTFLPILHYHSRDKEGETIVAPSQSRQLGLLHTGASHQQHPQQVHGGKARGHQPTLTCEHAPLTRKVVRGTTRLLATPGSACLPWHSWVANWPLAALAVALAKGSGWVPLQAHKHALRNTHMHTHMHTHSSNFQFINKHPFWCVSWRWLIPNVLG